MAQEQLRVHPRPGAGLRPAVGAEVAVPDLVDGHGRRPAFLVEELPPRPHDIRERYPVDDPPIVGPVDRDAAAHHGAVPRWHQESAHGDCGAERQGRGPPPWPRRGHRTRQHRGRGEHVQDGADLDGVLHPHARDQRVARHRDAEDRAARAHRVQAPDVAADPIRVPREHSDRARHRRADQQRGREQQQRAQDDLHGEHELRLAREAERARDEPREPVERRHHRECADRDRDQHPRERARPGRHRRRQPRGRGAADREAGERSDQHGRERVRRVADDEREHAGPGEPVHHRGRRSEADRREQGERNRRSRRPLAFTGASRSGGLARPAGAARPEPRRSRPPGAPPDNHRRKSHRDAEGGRDVEGRGRPEGGKRHVPRSRDAERGAERVHGPEPAHARRDSRPAAAGGAREQRQHPSRRHRRGQQEQQHEAKPDYAEAIVRDAEAERDARERGKQRRDQSAPDAGRARERAVEEDGVRSPVRDAADQHPAERETRQDRGEHRGRRGDRVAEDQSQHAEPHESGDERTGTGEEEAEENHDPTRMISCPSCLLASAGKPGSSASASACS